MRFSLLGLLSVVAAFPVEIPDYSEKYSVKNLPGIENIPEDDRPLMYAGHITVHEESNTNYFFWKFIKKRSEFNRTIIWLNGGPGCSSMDGALMETGPLRVGENKQLYINDGSWYQAADMIFVDQPGGTGFSITEDYDKDLVPIGDDFVSFLNNYFKEFPNDANNEIYIAGESYAGQYIPFIADSILRSNANNDSSINLQGLLIGNGWIAPNIQSLSYVPYLLESNIISTDDSFMPKLLKDHEKCQSLINSGSHDDSFSIGQCEIILNRVLQYTRDKSAPEDQQCINMYDTRLRDSYPSCGMNWPPDLVYVEPYLRAKEVVESLNLNYSTVKEWRECDGEVSKHLRNKNSKPSQYLFPNLLENLHIMLFNGNKDIICNNHGVLDFIDQLTWNGGKGFSEDTVIFDWKYDGNSTGDIRHDRNLTFVSIYDSSHMVPFDKPKESRGLFDIFVGNFKVIETINSTYIETPIYSNNSLSDSKDDPDVSTKSALPFIFYIGTVISVGAFVLVYNRGKNSNSILKTTTTKKHNRNKKSVSWADENGIDEESYPYPENDNSNDGKIGTFLNNFKSKEPNYKRVSSTSNDEENYENYESIELDSNLISENGHDNEEFDFDIADELENQSKN